MDFSKIRILPVKRKLPAPYLGSIGVAVIPARYGGVKRDKIKDKNG
jgi:hypothetical protein